MSRIWHSAATSLWHHKAPLFTGDLHNSRVLLCWAMMHLQDQNIGHGNLCSSSILKWPCKVLSGKGSKRSEWCHTTAYTTCMLYTPTHVASKWHIVVTEYRNFPMAYKKCIQKPCQSINHILFTKGSIQFYMENMLCNPPLGHRRGTHSAFRETHACRYCV